MVIMAPIKKARHAHLLKQRKIKVEKDLNNRDRDVPQDIQIIAQEVQIVKSLACNDLTQRNKQMQKLRKYLQLRTVSSFAFSQENFLRIWKGLYYNMWYSDKPLVQEELAEKLGKLLECFKGNLKYSVDFFGAFMKTMCIEWFGIDQWRIDKFLMLARRMLRYMFKLLKSSIWSVEAIEVFNKYATDTVLFENSSAKGLTMHYFDIFFEELAKISDGNISAEEVGLFVKPFVKFIATQRDFNLVSHCRTRVFYHLLYQSGLGREYTEKYNAWKEMGFPTRSIDELEKVEESELEENEVDVENVPKHLDPRAGNVDVLMPLLPLDVQYIITEIEHFLHKADCPTRRRKILKKLLDMLKIYENGKFPLGVKTMPRFEGKSAKPLLNEKIKQLQDFENELYGVDRKLKQMTKRKRRKLLKSLNFGDEIDESTYDQFLEKALPQDYLRERSKRSQKSFMASWVEEELNKEDLKPKKAKKETIFVKKSIQKSHAPKNKLNIQNLKSLGLLKTRKKLKTEKSLSGSNNKDAPAELYPDLVDKNTDEGKNNTSNFKQLKSLKPCDYDQYTPKYKLNESNVLKISDTAEPCTSNLKKKTNEWDKPLDRGEIEYFLPSRKLRLKNANSELVLNPLAKQHLEKKQFTPVSNKRKYFTATNTTNTPDSTKRVKIALKNNTSQNPLEYIQQIRSSPNIPYDAKKKPGKGLLKPNAMPSPINPFYKKKIGLKLLNDTF